MVSENHPNKCPHICLHLTVKQQTCRSGRSLAGGVTPAKAAHYTYRLKPCKPFLKKVLWPGAGAETGSKLLRGATRLTTAKAGRKVMNPVFSGSLRCQPITRCYTVCADAVGRGVIAITRAPQRLRHRLALDLHRSAPTKRDVARPTPSPGR